MSLIFDALQRSGFEKTGVEYPDMVSVATEVLEAAHERTPENQVAAEQPAEFQMLAIPMADDPAKTARPMFSPRFLRWMYTSNPTVASYVSRSRTVWQRRNFVSSVFACVSFDRTGL